MGSDPSPPDGASGLEFLGEVGRPSQPCGEGEGRRAQGTPGDHGRQEAPHIRNSGPADPTPAAQRFTSVTPRAGPRLEAELQCQVVAFGTVEVELTRGRAVGGTSGPQSGQMFPGRLPATYLTSLVGDAARGRNPRGPEPRGVEVMKPGVVGAC